jgi:hypothetical protein
MVKKRSDPQVAGKEQLRADSRLPGIDEGSLNTSENSLSLTPPLLIMIPSSAMIT